MAVQNHRPTLVQIVQLTPVEILNRCKEDLYGFVQWCFKALGDQFKKEEIIKAAKMTKFGQYKSLPLPRIYRHLPSFVQSQVRAILSMTLTNLNGSPRYPQSPFHKLPQNIIWDIIEMVIEYEIFDGFPADANILKIQGNPTFREAAELLYEFHSKYGLQLDIWYNFQATGN